MSLPNIKVKAPMPIVKNPKSTYRLVAQPYPGKEDLFYTVYGS